MRLLEIKTATQVLGPLLSYPSSDPASQQLCRCSSLTCTFILLGGLHYSVGEGGLEILGGWGPTFSTSYSQDSARGGG